jgi:hypothetical protein
MGKGVRHWHSGEMPFGGWKQKEKQHVEIFSRHAGPEIIASTTSTRVVHGEGLVLVQVVRHGYSRLQVLVM